MTSFLMLLARLYLSLADMEVVKEILMELRHFIVTEKSEGVVKYSQSDFDLARHFFTSIEDKQTKE